MIYWKRYYTSWWGMRKMVIIIRNIELLGCHRTLRGRMPGLGWLITNLWKPEGLLGLLSHLVAKGRKNEVSEFNSRSNGASENVEFLVPSCLLCQGQSPNREGMGSWDFEWGFLGRRSWEHWIPITLNMRGLHKCPFCKKSPPLLEDQWRSLKWGRCFIR